MKNNKLKKYIYKLIIVSSIIIIVNTLKALLISKDIELYEYYKNLNIVSSYDNFISIILLGYMVSILETFIITIFTLLTYKKYGISKIYKFIFGFIVAYRLLYIFITFDLNSIFYYLNIVLFIILFIIIIFAPINDKEGKK